MNQSQAAFRSRVWGALTTPPAIPAEGPRLKTNLDTDMLKLVAAFLCLSTISAAHFFRKLGLSAGLGVWLSPFSATA